MILNYLFLDLKTLPVTVGYGLDTLAGAEIRLARYLAICPRLSNFQFNSVSSETKKQQPEESVARENASDIHLIGLPLVWCDWKYLTDLDLFK